MTRTAKKVLSFFMSVLIAFSCAPAAFAAQQGGAQANAGQQVSYSAENSLGEIITNAIESEAEDSADYGILELTVEGAAVSATLRAADSCRLSVAIYSEEGTLISSDTAEIEAQQSEVELALSVSMMPAYYYVQAQLLDAEDNPLCEPFIDITHTQTFAEFEEKTVDDFDGQTVLNFDEAADDNFAAITKDAVIVTASDSANRLVSADHETGVYVFENADQTLASLNKGDILCYEPQSADMILVKVDSVETVGSTTTVTADQTAGLTEFFDYFRLDLTSDEVNGDDQRLDMTDADPDVEFLGFQEPETDDPELSNQSVGGELSTQSVEIGDGKITKKLPHFQSNNPHLNYSFNIEVSVSFQFNLFFSREWNWPWELAEAMKDYYLIEVAFDFGLAGSVEIKLETDEFIIPLGDLFFMTPVGLSIGTVLEFVLSASAEFRASIAEVSCRIGVRYENGIGWQNLSTSPRISFLPEVESEESISIALRVSPYARFTIFWVNFYQYNIGFKASLTQSLWDHWEQRHLCSDLCLGGELSFYSNGGLHIYYRIGWRSFDYSYDPDSYDWSLKALDFHIKWEDGGLHFYRGKCPNFGYQVDISVVDESGRPLPNATVSLGGGFTPDGEGKYTQANAMTDENGCVTAYYPPGDYTVAADKENYESASMALTVAENPTSIQLTLEKQPDTPDDPDQPTEPTEPTEPTGSNDKWEFSLAGRKKYCTRSLRIDKNNWVSVDYYVYTEVIITQTPGGSVSIPTTVSIKQIPSGSYRTSNGGSHSICLGETVYPSASGTAVKESITCKVTGIYYKIFQSRTSVRHVTIPEGLVTSIEYAKSSGVDGSVSFYGCTGLKSVSIPNSVTSIGNSAFEGCASLTSMSIPNSVTSIGNSAFSGCTSLTSMSIPNSVTSIGNYAFSGCTDLTSVTIGNSVTSIGKHAFSNCTGLMSVTIPDSVTDIGAGAFINCNNLKRLIIAGAPQIGNNAYGNDYSFQDCPIEYLEMPPLGYIGNQRSALKTLVITGSITDNTIIPGGSFINCDNLERVTIQNGITSIGGSAFCNCTGLTSVIISDSVTSIGGSAFKNCTGLTNVAIPDGVTIIGGRAFYGCTGLMSIIIPNRVTSVNDEAFYGCTGLTSITIPNSVASIGRSAFKNCTGLKSVTIPGSVTSINSEAFYNCTGLKSVTIPDGVTSIGGGAFYNCTGLKSVTIPDSVTSIGNYAFDYCFGLTSVTIPYGVTSIGSCAFGDCTGLTEINYNAVNVSDLVDDYSGIFYNAGIYGGGITISFGNEVEMIPDALLRDSNIKSVIIPNSVTSIGHMAFYGCTGLTSVTIGNSVTSIGDNAFRGCTGLTSVTIPDSVTSIGYCAFCDCTGLTSVIIPDSVTSIDSNAFYRVANVVYHGTASGSPWGARTVNGYEEHQLVYADSSKTSLLSGLPSCSGEVIIPDSVRRINSDAFRSCTGLTSVIIGNSVTSIGNYCFYGCTGLTSVIIGNNVTSIGNYCFYGCTGLTSVTIPKTVKTIGSNFFTDLHDNSHEMFESELIDILENYSAEEIAELKAELQEMCNGNGSVYIYETVTFDEVFYYLDHGTWPPTTTICSIDVYYEGTEAEWNQIEIGSDNEVLLNANIHFLGLAHSHSDGDGDGLCDVCGGTVSDILPGETKTVEITGDGIAYLYFVPKLTGVYTFASSASDDAYGYLFDANKNEIVSNDNDGTGNNFKITYSLIKGQRYYFGCRLNDSLSSGSLPVTLTLDSVLETLQATEEKDVVIDTLNGSIYGIEPNTTDLSAYFNEQEGYAYTCSGMVRDGVYSTGTTVNVYSGDIFVASYTLVLFGDVDGDSWYDGTDAYFVRLVANGMISADALTDAQRMAADCNHDGVIDNADVALLEQAGLLLANVDQSAPSAELQANSVYLEYCSLIDQSIEITEPAPTEANEPAAEQGSATNVWQIIFDLFKRLVNFVTMMFSIVVLPK